MSDISFMDQYLSSAVARFAPSTNVLLVGVQVFVSAVLIALWRVGAVPIASFGTFAFVVALVVLFALHRPRWAFWFFVGSLPFEAVNVAPDALGVGVRPYQIVGAALIGALIVRGATGRLPRGMFRVQWFDWAVVAFMVGGFVAAVFGAVDTGAALMQAVIAASFGAWYFLARYFVRGPKSAREPLYFLLASFVVVGVFALWQNLQAMAGMDAGAVMSARPNATFSEPNWLGIFAVFAFAMTLCAWLYGAARVHISARVSGALLGAMHGGFALLVLLEVIVMVIVVSRSAWLGVGAVVVLLVGYLVWRRGVWLSVTVVGGTVLASLFALLIVQVAGLTQFEIASRAQSAGGLQEITIACADVQKSVPLAEEGFVIGSVDELAGYGCAHIDLEAIDAEVAAGKTVQRVLRPDPSVGVRKDVYAKVRAELTHGAVWLTGTGWNQSWRFLGADSSGTPLNTSNLFIETWFGAGLVGLIGLVALLGQVVWRGASAALKHPVASQRALFGVAAVLGVLAIVVPNLFNAGILMGFVWVFLGMVASLRK